MESWTAPSDVTDAWIGEGQPTETNKIQTWIEKAERVIRSRIPDLQERIEAQADELPPRSELLETTKDIVVSMVIRVFRNPEGIRSTNETAGPFTKMKTYGGDTPGGLIITDAELTKLQGATSGAFSIDLIPSTSPFYTRATT